MTDYSKISNKGLHSLLESSMCEAIKQFSSEDNAVSAVILENRLEVLKKWVVLSIFNSDYFSLAVSLHYDPKNLEQFVAKSLRVSISELTTTNIHGIVKEINNTFTGYLGNRLVAINAESGFSLPILAQGFDFLNFSNDKIKKEESFMNISLGNSQSFAVCFSIETSNWLKLCALDFQPCLELSQESGAIELL